MFSLLSNLSIKKTLSFLVFAGLIVPSIIITIIVYLYTSHSISTDYIQTYIETNFNETEENFSNVASLLNTITLTVSNSSEVKSLAFSNNNETTQTNISKMFNEILKNSSIISAIDFIDTKGKIYKFGEIQYDSKALSKSFLKNLNTSCLYIDKNFIATSNSTLLPFGKQMYSYMASYPLGYVIYYIDAAKIFSFTQNSDKKNMFLIQLDNSIILHSENMYNDDMISEHSPLTNTNFTTKFYSLDNPAIKNKVNIIGIFNNDYLYAPLNTIVKYLLLFLVVLSIIVIALATLIPKRLTNNIVKLKTAIDEFSLKATPISEQSTTSKNEISALEQSFFEMSRRIVGLIEKNKQEQNEKRIAEINLLQSQINPHFIYNAIDTISWKAKENEQMEIDDMLITLATYFRIGLHKGDTTITISDEINHVKSYMSLELMRFPTLFEYEFDIPEEILQVNIIKIILQPIVENSIKHGFKNKKITYKLKISAEISDNDIVFTISDNGVGIDFSDGNAPFPKSNKKLGGLGLLNINQRLILQYGSDYGLIFHSKENEGTTVTIRIPYTKNQNPPQPFGLNP